MCADARAAREGPLQRACRVSAVKDGMGMASNQQQDGRMRRRVWRWMGVGLWLLMASFAQADVQLPQGEYFTNIDDLTVKVLGGEVTAQRTWYQGQWHFNRTWSPLTFSYDTLTGEVKTIQRNDDVFERDPTNPNRYRFDVGLTIERTANGWRWADRQRNWIDYDTEGRVQAYGNRNDVTVTLHYDAQGRRSAVHDHFDNPVLTYEYDGDSNRVRFVRSTTRAVEYRYTGERLTEVIDVLGHSTNYTYEGDQLKTLTDPENRTTTLAYGPTGQLIRETGEDGLAVQYRYDYDKTRREYYVRQTGLDGRVVERWYDREGVETRRAVNGTDERRMRYDGNHRIVTDERGLETRYERDAWDNVTKTVYPDGASESTTYDYRFDLPKQKTDALGRITAYSYDANGNLTRMTEAQGTSDERITDYTYDGYGQRKTETRKGSEPSQDALTQYSYDNQGNLTQVIDPETHTTAYTHDEMGNVLTRTDANNHTWTDTYNAAGWLETEKDPENNLTTYTYDKVGNRTSMTDARNHASSAIFDVRDRLTAATDFEGHTNTLSYDPVGRLTVFTDPLTNKTVRDYDADGRLLSQTDPADNRTEQRYDSGGGLNADVAYPGLVTGIHYPTFLQTYDYDRRDRRIRTINHLSPTEKQVNETTYDVVGNRISITDTQGRLIQYHYDALDRLIEIIDPLGQSTTFAYDARDNLIAVTDPNEHTTQYRYDKADRKIAEIRPLGETYTYAYDPTGNLAERADPDGRRTAYAYDDTNRLTQQRHYLPNTATPERTVDFTYDANGNLLSWSDGSYSATYTYDKNDRKLSETVAYGAFSLSHHYTYDAAGNKASYTAPDGTVITYHWDKDRLQRIELPTVGSINYARYRWASPDLITYPGGGQRQIAHDPLLRPETIVAEDPAANAVMDFAYTYDAAGNIIQKVTETLAYDYTYDALDRLTESASALEVEGWTYDPNGNRLSDNLNPGSWTYNDNDELTESPTATYTYDDAGNPLTKTDGGQTFNYAYNAENRLIRVTDDTNPIGEYTYDPFGRRIKKVTQTETRYFHYSDEGLVGEYDQTGASIRHYGYEPDSTWTTSPLYQRQGGEVAYYQNDHLGTPQRLVKANGAVVWAGQYRAFGEVTETTTVWANPLRFPGQYYDPETGQHYNFFRDYDPTIGRYTQRDPIGLMLDINVYSYAYNDPIYYTDNRGLFGVVGVAQEIVRELGCAGIEGYIENQKNEFNRHAKNKLNASINSLNNKKEAKLFECNKINCAPKRNKCRSDVSKWFIDALDKEYQSYHNEIDNNPWNNASTYNPCKLFGNNPLPKKPKPGDV